jgi:outer membrane protein
MKNYILCGAVFLSIAFAKAQSQKAWTLRECVTYALENNISIKLTQLQAENAKVEKKLAVGGLLPTLNARSSFNSNTGANVNPVTNQFENNTFFSITPGASSNLTLFDGLANFKRVQRANLSALLAQYQLEQSENDIMLLVANSYLQALLAKENLKTILNQHEVTALSIENTQNLVDAGSLPQGDLLEIKATYANEEQQIVAARNNVKITLINLAQALNITDYENFDIAQPEITSTEAGILVNSAQDIAGTALENRPEIKIADQNIAIAEKDLQISKAARYPSISAFLSYNSRFSDNDFLDRTLQEQLYQNDGYAIGFQVNVPIFNGFRVSSDVARNKVNVESQRLQKEQAALNLETNIYQAYNDAQAAQASYQAAEETVQARELAFQYAKDRYDVGLMNSFDFNQAQNQLLNARVNRNQSKYDFIFRIKVLEIFYGISPEDLKL